MGMHPAAFSDQRRDFYRVGETEAGWSMLTGLGGETCRAMKQVTFNTVSPIAIVKKMG
jgi:hypothetical protein